MVFQSAAENLVAGDTNGFADIFLRDRLLGTTTLISKAGAGSGNNSSHEPVISADGSTVAFSSNASNLVANDTNNRRDVFVWDASQGVRLVSTTGAGSSFGQSLSPAISADGSTVAFTSHASDLVANDSNGTWDIFVWDAIAGVRLVSTTGAGSGDGQSFGPAVISADGSTVAFTSNASNLVANDSNGTTQDVFVWDAIAGVRLVSTTGAGSGSSSSGGPVISADGSTVAFHSNASNLVANDTNGFSNVFVWDAVAGVRLVSTTGTGSGNNSSGGPVITADGSTVAFTSSASNLAANDSNGSSPDVFVWDATQGVRLVSKAGDGSGNFGSSNPVISADGSAVAFTSSASNLVANDSNGSSQDVFVWDATRGVRLVSTTGTGSGNGISRHPVINADGSTVAFESHASNLVANDSNGTWDVFVASVQTFNATLLFNWTGGTYDGNSFGATGSATDIDGTVIAPLRFTYFVGSETNGAVLPGAPVNAGTYTVLAEFAGLAPYPAASLTATITIDKAFATISVSGKTVTYDGTAHRASGSATGVNGVALAGLNLGDSFTNAPGGTANWVFTDATGNYLDAMGSVAIVINKPTANISIDGTRIEGAPLTLSVVISNTSTLATLSYSWTVFAIGSQSPAASGTGEQFTFIPVDDGDYHLVLAVYSGDTELLLAEQLVTISNVAPTTSLLGVARVEQGMPYAMTIAPIVDPGSDTVQWYIINWGDGTTQIMSAADLDAAGRQIEHVYSGGIGVQGITISVIDEDGEHVSVAQATVTVFSTPTVEQAAEFVGEIDTFIDPDPGSGPDTTYTVIVDWGDGTQETITGTAFELGGGAPAPTSGGGQRVSIGGGEGSSSARRRSFSGPGVRIGSVSVFRDFTDGSPSRMIQVNIRSFDPTSDLTTPRVSLDTAGLENIYRKLSTDLDSVANAILLYLQDAGEFLVDVVQYLYRVASGLFMSLLPSAYMKTSFSYDVINPLACSGEPVWYVNGMATFKSSGIVEATELSKKLRRPVHFIYNPTALHPYEPVDGDLTDMVATTLSAGADLVQAYLDVLWQPPIPQHNETTKEVAGLLYTAAKREQNISIVGYSQGTAIINNAILTVDARNEFTGLFSADHSGWSDRKLAFVAAGAPLFQTHTRPARFTALRHEGDPVTELFSGNLDISTWVASKHNFAGATGDEYVYEITNDMLWHSASSCGTNEPWTMSFPTQESFIGESFINWSSAFSTVTFTGDLLGVGMPAGGLTAFSGSALGSSPSDYRVVVLNSTGSAVSANITEEGQGNFLIRLDQQYETPGTHEFLVFVMDKDGNVAFTPATVTVPRATPTIPIDWIGGTYNGSEFIATGAVLGLDDSEIGTPTFTYFVGIDTTGMGLATAPVGAGTYTVRADFAGDALHSAASATATIVIDKANATIVVNGSMSVYDGNARRLSGTAIGAASENLSVLLDLGTNQIGSGTYLTAWSFTGDANHNPASGLETIQIDKANALILIAGTTVTYDGTAHGASGSVTGVNGETLAGLDLGASFTNAPGNAAIWAFNDVTGNYLDASGSVAIVINKAAATINVNGTTVTYDSTAHGANGSAVGVNGETLAGLDLGASFINVPGGTANWAFTDATGNYLDASGSVEIVIRKRAVTVTANHQSKVYGTDDPLLTYAVTDGSLAANDAFFGELARESGEAVGTYAISQGSLTLNDEFENYDLSFVEAELEITHAILTGDATTQDALNTAKQGKLNITVSNIAGFVNGENTAVFLSNASFWITINDQRYEFVPTSVTLLSDSSISISYTLKNSELQASLATALELATSGATAIAAGFMMESTNYRLSDDYLSRLFSTVKS